MSLGRTPLRSILLRSCAALSISFACMCAQATIITGNFTGNISRVLTPAGDSTVGLGNPATGSFFIDTSYFTFSGTDESSYAEYSYFNADPTARSLELNFDFGTGSQLYNIGAQTIRLQRLNGADTIYLSNYYPKGFGASLTLAGDSGSLFDAFTPDAIYDGGVVNPAASHVYTGSDLEENGNFGTFVTLSSANIAVGEVPEPGTLSMMLFALGIGSALRVARNRRVRTAG